MFTVNTDQVGVWIEIPVSQKLRLLRNTVFFFTLGSVMSQRGDLLIWSSQVHPPACHTQAVVDCQSEEMRLKGGGAKSAFFLLNPEARPGNHFLDEFTAQSLILGSCWIKTQFWGNAFFWGLVIDNSLVSEYAVFLLLNKLTAVNSPLCSPVGF